MSGCPPRLGVRARSLPASSCVPDAGVSPAAGRSATPGGPRTCRPECPNRRASLAVPDPRQLWSGPPATVDDRHGAGSAPQRSATFGPQLRAAVAVLRSPGRSDPPNGPAGTRRTTPRQPAGPFLPTGMSALSRGDRLNRGHARLRRITRHYQLGSFSLKPASFSSNVNHKSIL